MTVNGQQRPEFFDGEVTKWHELVGLALGEILYPPSFSRPAHIHEHACLHFSFSGGYTECQGRRTLECNTSTLSFQPQGHEHSYRCHQARTRSFTIEIGQDWLERLRQHSIILDTVANFEGGLLLWLINRLYNEFCIMEAASPLIIEGIALEVLVEASRKQVKILERRPPAWLKKVEELLNEQFAESMSLQDIARSVGIHQVHLSRVFRQHYGCTAGEYLRQLRIDFSCREMSRGDSSLAQIALAAGFSDQSQFSRTFKRAMGMTPAQFRAAIRSR